MLMRWMAGLALLALLGGCSKEENLQKYLSSGKAFVEQGNLDKARIEFRNAIQVDPKTPGPHYELAKVLWDQQKWKPALGQLLAVVELDPHHIDARIRLAKLYLLGSNLEQSRGYINKVLTDDPGNPAALAINAVIEMRYGNLDKAESLAKEALALDTHVEEVYSVLGAVYQKRGERKQSIKVLQDGLKVFPDNLILHTLIISLYFEAERFAEAEQAIKQLIALKPDEYAYQIQLAQFYTSQKRNDEAEHVLQAAMKQAPDEQKRVLAMADFLFQVRNQDKAIKMLQDHIAKRPNDYQVQFGLARLYHSEQRFDEEQAVLKRIVALDKGIGPEALKAKDQQASYLMQQGKRKEAQAMVADILKTNTQDEQALILRGWMGLGEGKYKNAIADFRTVLKNQPANELVLHLLAQAHALNGHPELAREQLTKAVRYNPRSEKAHLKLLQFDILQKDYDQGMKHAEAMLQALPGNIQAQQAVVDIRMAQNDQGKAEQAAKQLIASHPDMAIGPYKLGLILAKNGKLKEAEDELKRALKLAPEAYEPVASLAKLYKMQKRDKDAEALLKRGVKDATKQGKAAKMLLLGDFYAATDRKDLAGEQYKDAIGANSTWAVPYRNLANVYAEKGNLKQAVVTYEEAYKKNPDNPRFALILATVYQRVDRIDDAVNLYEKMLKKSESNVVAANNLASLLAEYKDTPKNLDRALALVKHFQESDNAMLLDTLGWVYFKKGQYRQALFLLQRASKASRQGVVAEIEYHLGQAQQATGQLNEAKSSYQRANKLAHSARLDKQLKQALATF